MPEPIVTVWRNKIPHQCSLLYWGQKWRIYKRRPRRVKVWSAHAPVNGGETLVIDTRHIPGKGANLLHCFHADGSPIVVVGPAAVPDA